jgi:hypothetical protein
MSEAGMPCRILNPWPDQEVDLCEVVNGEYRSYSFHMEDDVIVLDTKVGGRYYIKHVDGQQQNQGNCRGEDGSARIPEVG